jgi:hypothetical protein
VLVATAKREQLPACGDTELAVELAIEDLKGGDFPGFLDYRHVEFYKWLAQAPLVAERLNELGAEAKIGGEKIWAYIVAHELQL